MWQFWVILAGIFFVIEAATIGFLVFWFGIGALIAMVVSLFTSSLAIQTTVFILSSTILLFFTRPLVNKLIYKKDDDVQTNAFSIIGKKGIVTKTIDPISGQGQVKIGTETWSAKSADEVKIEKGLEVEVLDIDGVRAVVRY